MFLKRENTCIVGNYPEHFLENSIFTIVTVRLEPPPQVIITDS